GVTTLIEFRAVERSAYLLLEVPPRIPALERSDHERPFLRGQLLAMLTVEPLPARPSRRFGIEDQAVEIKEQRANLHSAELRDRPSPIAPAPLSSAEQRRTSPPRSRARAPQRGEGRPRG